MSRDWPVLPTQAGHDAGILAAAGHPTAMLFVRNPTGVSHSPAEFAETADCLAGVEALADVLGGAGGMTTLSVPAMANAHSHAFHRALRGRTQQGTGSFWTWREQMYDLAARLTPDLYFELARAAYAEMVAGGIGAVGEFHYLHHQPDGTPYDDPNEMGRALLAAADDVGIRIRLLDTCYLTAGIGQPAEGVQRRFSDGSADAWAERVAAFDDDRVGAAIHSVRAVPQDQMSTVAAWAAAGRCTSTCPSSPRRTTPAWRRTDSARPSCSPRPACSAPARRSCTRPTSPTRTSASSATPAASCASARRRSATWPTDSAAVPTCGRPAPGSRSAPTATRSSTCSRRCAGSRCTTGCGPGCAGTGRRRRCCAARPIDGHASLGLDQDGVVILDPASPRTAGAGADEHAAVYAATAADVTEVVLDGEVVFDGDHARVGRDLEVAIGKVWP